VDFVVEEEAASSTPQVPNRPVPGTAAVHAARQHTTAQTSRTPSRATPGALSAARELLRHPPSSTASPRAMRQWHDDVDRLLSVAHSGSVRPRPRASRRQYEASASVRSPSVRAAPTEDLRAELNRRHAVEDAQVPPERLEDLRDELNRRRVGKDACISLERARERRGNLEQDFAVVALQAPEDARFQTSISLAGVGCAALANHLRAATWPPKFRPHLPEKYDGTTNPSEPAGLCHRHYDSRGRHIRNGNLLPCSLVWASPDLAHEPSPRIHILLGRALRAVRGELRQRLPAAWCGGTPPCSEVGTQGDSPGIHFPLHQGTWDNPPYLGYFHHHCFPPGGM
jgi:hypothetical protein